MLPKNKTYFYVYRITNIYLKKYYYGSRSTNSIPHDEIGTSYYSSSTDLLFIEDQKTNPQNYRYKIIFVFNCFEKAINLEIKLHKKFDVGNNPSFYNKSLQTSSKWSTTGISHTRNKGENNPMFGKIRTDHSERMSGSNNSFYGLSHSEDTKNIISITNKNMVVCRNILTGETVRVSKEIFKSDRNLVGVTSGCKLSDEIKKKISISSRRPRGPRRKVECPHCLRMIGVNVASRFHFDNCKFLVDKNS